MAGVVDRAGLDGEVLYLEAAVLVEGDACVLLPARGPEDVQLDHRRLAGVELDRQLHRAALDAFQHHFLVGGELRRPDVPMVMPEGLDVAGGLDTHVVVSR